LAQRQSDRAVLLERAFKCSRHEVERSTVHAWPPSIRQVGTIAAISAVKAAGLSAHPPDTSASRAQRAEASLAASRTPAFVAPGKPSPTIALRRPHARVRTRRSRLLRRRCARAVRIVDGRRRLALCSPGRRHRDLRDQRIGRVRIRHRLRRQRRDAADDSFRPPAGEESDDPLGDVGGVRFRLCESGAGRVQSPQTRAPEPQSAVCETDGAQVSQRARGPFRTRVRKQRPVTADVLGFRYGRR
jgi:hypothetical protein